MFRIIAIKTKFQFVDVLLMLFLAASNMYVAGNQKDRSRNPGGRTLTGNRAAVNGWKRKIKPQARA